LVIALAYSMWAPGNSKLRDSRVSRLFIFSSSGNTKMGYESAWVVRKYGVRLTPELYEHLNPMPFEAAAQMELELAEDLRAAGYTVTGGH